MTDVEIKSFTAKATGGNDAIDSDLTLTLKGKAGEFGESTELFKAGEGLKSTPIDNIFVKNTQWDFTIGGLYDSEDFDEPRQPEYSMVLLFTKR
jgi:hypothetical protein